MKNLAFATVLLFNSLAFAECKPVTYLKEGTPTPCTGYLFTPAEEKEVRNLKDRYEIQQEINLQQKQLIFNLSENVEVTTKLAQNYERKADQAEARNFFDKVAYFGIGILLGYGVARVVGP